MSFLLPSPIILLIAASVAFSIGGLFMKFSGGMARIGPTFTFLTLFLLGAALQGLAMRREDLGVAYIFVLGLEAVLTMFLSVLVLGESCSPGRIGSVLLIVLGIVLLHRT